MNLHNAKSSSRILGLVAWLSLIASAQTVAFKAVESYPVGLNPNSAVAADLNGDGKPDLAVNNGGSNNVSILFGNGDGTFQPARNFDTGSSAGPLAVADFNGDGIPDLAAITAPNGTTAGQLHVLVGNGDGSFQQPILTTLNDQDAAVALADVNGDKKADLLVNLSGGTATGIGLMVGNGDGTFQTPVTLLSGTQTLLTVADFDNDGKPDLALAASGAVQIMTGRGDGTFSQGAQAVLMGAFSPGRVWTADLNGDGKLDLIVNSWSSTCVGYNCRSNQHVSAFLASSSGDFSNEHLILVGNSTRNAIGFGSFDVITTVAPGDFNGDGMLDIATRKETGTSPIWARKPTWTFAFDLGDGKGSFAPIDQTDPGNVAFATDLNSDQLADLVVLDSANNSVGVLLNSTPTFTLSASSSTLTAVPGGQATSTIALTSVNGFGSTVQFSCQAIGPAPTPVCSLSPGAITGGPGSPTSTLTVEVPTDAALVPSGDGGRFRTLLALGFPVALIGLGLPGRGLRTTCKRYVLGIALAAGAVLGIACGGQSSLPPVHHSQLYTVRVTAASTSVTKSMQFSLTVQ